MDIPDWDRVLYWRIYSTNVSQYCCESSILIFDHQPPAGGVFNCSTVRGKDVFVSLPSVFSDASLPVRLVEASVVISRRTDCRRTYSRCQEPFDIIDDITDEGSSCKVQ